MHYVSLLEPLTNGNSNGMGTIIRYENGNIIWGAMGPRKGRSEEHATIWVILTALIFLADNDYHQIDLETLDDEVYNTIWPRERIVIPPYLSEVMTHFDSLYSSSYKEGKTIRCISMI